MRKVAILGGTFDPVHWGHLLIAETGLSQATLDQVIWVPDRCPPHKRAAVFEHRLEMVRLAIADHPAFAISSGAINHSGPSYAIQTLIELQALYMNTQWYWIVGLDAFQTLPRWHQRQELAAQCNWLVVPRLVLGAPPREEPGAMTARLESICNEVAQQLADQFISIRWQLLQMPWIGVSSSLIRQYCRNGYVNAEGVRSSIRYLVPEAVRIYIATHNLYLDGSG